MADVYKLLHQATMGSEHAMPNPQMAEDWMKREVATLGDGPSEPMIDTLGSAGRFVRVHLRPYLTAGGSADSLVAAFVRTAQQAKPDTVAIKCALAAWQARSAENASPWNMDGVKAFVAARAKSGYQAIEHSDAFVAKYRPAYRVVLRELAPSLQGGRAKPLVSTPDPDSVIVLGTLTGTSSFQVNQNDRGCPYTVQATNVRFVMYPSADDPVPGTVLREEFRFTKCVPSEGNGGMVKLQAWATDSSLSLPPRYTISVGATSTEIMSNGWYKVFQMGCCGTGDDWVYFNLKNGKELFTSSGQQPIRLQNDYSKSYGGRVISVHDSYSAWSSHEMDRDSTVVAVIEYGIDDGDQPSDRYILRRPNAKQTQNWNVSALHFLGAVTAADSIFRHVRRVPGFAQPPATAGVSVAMRFTSPFDHGDPFSLAIPIEDDRLVVERVVLPSGFVFERSSRQPR